MMSMNGRLILSKGYSKVGVDEESRVGIGSSLIV